MDSSDKFLYGSILFVLLSGTSRILGNDGMATFEFALSLLLLIAALITGFSRRQE